MMVQVGYSGGLRSKPAFDWSKNLLVKTHTADSIKQFDYSCSSVYALLWNMCTHRLPPSIISDISGFLQYTRLPYIDSNQRKEGLHAGYII